MNLDYDKKIKENLNSFGFVVMKNFFSQEDLDKFENCVVSLYSQQAKKIGDYRNLVLDLEKSKKNNFEKFSEIYSIMEDKDKEALYQVQKLIQSSPNAREIFNKTFLEITCRILRSNLNNILIDGPALFVNKPNTQRLLYKWHSESHYYPKRRRFLNIWFPLFHNKTKTNGTMSFKQKSHLENFPFADYQGFNKDTENKSNFFIQYEVPENFLKDYSEYHCECSLGDLVIFDKNLVHRSNINTSENYSVAVVARVWDPSDDLTLSGNMAAQPYGKNIGRSNLIVNPDIDKNL